MNFFLHIARVGLLYCLISCLSWTSLGQTVFIPDNCLRNEFVNRYPQFMTQDSLLNISLAQNHFGDINLSNSCIQNISGLENFTNIASLNLKNNQIKEINPVILCEQLRYLYLNKNKIENIKPLLSLPHLIHLEISENFIESFPQPDTLLKLKNLYCYSCNLKRFQFIDSLPELKILVLGDNPIDSLPPLLNHTQLTQLHINNTKITIIPNLDLLVNLEALYCQNGLIKTLDGLENNTKLSILRAHDNLLTQLPLLLNKPLSELLIFNNQLTFEDILPIKKHSNFPDFIVSPQNNVFVNSNTIARIKDDVKFQTTIDKNIEGMVYLWFKNNVSIQTSQSPELTLTNITTLDSGNYHLEIKNALIDSLVLTSFNWRVSIAPCLDAKKDEVNISKIDCSDGLDINFSGIEVQSNNPPFVFSLLNKVNLDTISSTLPEFENIAPGNYTLIVSDQKKCIHTSELQLNTPTECQQVFSPNGDGIMDNYFISTPGTTKILNRQREIIMELTTPASWDGRTTNGSIAIPGKYIIITNETIAEQVNLVR